MLESAVIEKLSQPQGKAVVSKIGSAIQSGSEEAKKTMVELFQKLGVSPKEKIECQVCWE